VIGKHEEPLPPDAKYTVYVISWRVFGPTECVSLHKICQNGDVQQGDTTALVRDLSNEVRSIKEDFLIKLARHAEEPEES
jgi:hypothetical protein